MRTPKQLIQKWLGIEAIATRLAEIDLELRPVPDYSEFGRLADVVDDGTNVAEYDTIAKTNYDNVITKGYDKSE